MAALLPEIEVVADCPFSCDPANPGALCDTCKERVSRGESLPIARRRTRFVDLPVSATEDRVVGTLDIERAHKFYRDTLSLTPAFEGDTQVGYFLGQSILMLKTNWYAPPSDKLNPRITIATEQATETEKALRERGVTIPDPVQPYDDFYVGSFLDSEGNKLWFCSPVMK